MNTVTKIEHPQYLPADPMVNMIERMVTDPASDLDKLERMLAMKERLDAHSAMVAFSQALADARAEIPPIIKDATVDFTSPKGRTHYQHETLAGIARAIDPILSKFGLSYRFRTGQQGGVMVTCIISHRQGHSEETSLSAAPDQSGNKNGFQAVGSAVTYLQRYTLKAALGLSAEVDDDAQSAAPRPSERRAPAPKPEAKPAATNETRRDWLKTTMATADTREKLQGWWTGKNIAAAHAALPEAMRDELTAEYNRLFDAMAPAPAADLDDDTIPF